MTAADEATPEQSARHRAVPADDWLKSAVPNRPTGPTPAAPPEVRVEADPTAPPLPRRRHLRAAAPTATQEPPVVPVATAPVVTAPVATAPVATAPVVEAPVVEAPVAAPEAPPTDPTEETPRRRARANRATDLSGRPVVAEASFFSDPTRPPAFNPGNLDPTRFGRNGYHGSAGIDAPPRRRKNRARPFIVLGVVLLVAGGFAQWGAPVVWKAALDASHASVVSDLEEVAAAEGSYRSLYGSYSGDRTQLATPETFNDVTIVSATAAGYCLRGSGLVGPPVFMTVRGLTDRPCS